jgi:transposase InsO family protein
VIVKRADLDPAAPIVRHEWADPGDLVHIGTRKLGRTEHVGQRGTGNRRDTVSCPGWEFLFVAIDDHARIGFTDLYPDEGRLSAVEFLHNTVAYFQSLGVHPQQVLTDNGSAFRSRAFGKACEDLGLRHLFTCPYTPKTHGNAARFIQSALREWADGSAYHPAS